ncbi:MAG: hypothetical protein IKI63_02900 [Clostridia bacterium]|nr:hypothetical protein [Clostridia bacterium]
MFLFWLGFSCWSRFFFLFVADCVRDGGCLVVVARVVVDVTAAPAVVDMTVALGFTADLWSVAVVVSRERSAWLSVDSVLPFVAAVQATADTMIVRQTIIPIIRFIISPRPG